MSQKKIARISLALLAFFLLLCFSGRSEAAVSRTWAAAVGSDDVYYIPINDTFYNNSTPPKVGTLYGWGIRGVKVAECDPPSWDAGGTAKNGEHKIPDRSFDVVLDEHTLANASFEVLVDLEAESTGVPSVTIQEFDGSTANLAIQSHYLNEINRKNHTINVQLDNDGAATKEIWVFRVAAGGGPAAKHTFYFSRAEADASKDPKPEDVVSIDIASPPERAEYIEGQKFDRVGMVVLATLTSGDVVPINGYTVALPGSGGEDTLGTADTYVVISFGSFEVQQPIAVLPGTGIADVRILNGQLYFDWKHIVDARFEKKDREYDAVVLYGEQSGVFSFSASEKAEVTADNDGEITKSGDLRIAKLAPDGTTIITVAAGGTQASYTFRCYQQAHSGMPSEVVEFICPASQYTNGAILGAYGMNPWGTLIAKDTSLHASGGMFNGPTSLGNFGGYIVYRYDEPITDDPDNPYGVDFLVYGNQLHPYQSSAEPGNVLVSENGEDWYTLAGSAHYEDYAKWGASITYKKTVAGTEIWLDGDYLGIGDKYPMRPYYPLFPWTDALEEEMTFTGVMLDPGNVADAYGSKSASFPDFGYADTGERTDSYLAGNPYVGMYGKDGSLWTKRTGADGFDLKWAVSDDGSPVDLSQKNIYFIKIQTASNVGSGGGGIGEKSTEINGVRRADPAAEGVYVDVTEPPSAVKVNGQVVELTNGGVTTVKVPESGVFTVNVTPHDVAGANVYINGSRNKSRSFSKMPEHEMIRVIVQEGINAPFIAYIKLTDTDPPPPPQYATVKLDANGGGFLTSSGLVESADLTYTQYTPADDRAFPIPEKEGAAFLGWYDANNGKYEAYKETMPETLSLKAKWEYDLKAVKLDADGGWFTLAGKLAQSALLTFTVETPASSRAFPTPEKDGHKFLGWQDPDGIKYTGFEDTMPVWLELKATWEVVTVTIAPEAGKSGDVTPASNTGTSGDVTPSNNTTTTVAVEISAGNYNFNPSTGIETVTVTYNDLTAAIDKTVTAALATGNTPEIVIQAPATLASSAVSKSQTAIPVTALKKAAESEAEDISVKIESAISEVKLDKAALEDLVWEAGSAETIVVAIEHKDKGAQDDGEPLTPAQQVAVNDEKVREVYDVSLYTDNGDKLDGFQTATGKLTIGLRYKLKGGETGNGVWVRYIGEDGHTERMDYGREYDGKNELAKFITNHLSVYAVTYEPVYDDNPATGTEEGDETASPTQIYDDAPSSGGCGAGAFGMALLLALALGAALRRKTQ